MANTEMRHFPKVTNQKTDKRRLYANQKNGLGQDSLREENGISTLTNFTCEQYPYLVSRKKFKKKVFPYNFSDGVFMFDGSVYYANNGGLYRDGRRIADVSAGNKRLLQFTGGKILIFPDMLCYNPNTDECATFGYNTGQIKYVISSVMIGPINWGLSAITSVECRLTDYFKAGEGVTVTDRNSILTLNGYHTIMEVDTDTNTLIFPQNEFGTGSERLINGVITHGAPERCDAACVCNGRVWVASGEKIKASSINNERSWSLNDGGDGSSFQCRYDGTEKINAGIEYQGCPLFFSENKIYMVYGDRPANFYLKCISNWGGITETMKNTVASVRDKVFYVSKYGVTCFDGNKPKLLENVPFSCDGATVIAGADRENYYVCVTNSSGQKLYAYDVSHDFWRDYGNHGLLNFFNYNDALCATNGTSIIVISDNGVDFTTGYSADETILLLAEFIFNTHGASPTSFVLDCDTGESSTLIAAIAHDCSTLKHVGTISSNNHTPVKFNIVPKKCNKTRIYLYGAGDVVIKRAYMDVNC